MSAVENGKRMRALRGERTIREMANAIGISESALRMYETGERNPRDDVKVAIAKAYGASVRVIFYPEDHEM